MWGLPEAFTTETLPCSAPQLQVRSTISSPLGVPDDPGSELLQQAIPQHFPVESQVHAPDPGRSPHTAGGSSVELPWETTGSPQR
jgi:hypothetical protein